MFKTMKDKIENTITYKTKTNILLMGRNKQE